jgi:putative ABC transport system substrate-binding protein
VQHRSTRRQLLQSVGVAGLVWLAGCGRPSGGEPSARVARIGYLGSSRGLSPTEEAFQQGLRELGYVEGQNVVVEWRLTEGVSDRFPALAADLVQQGVDVIVAPTTLAALAAKGATSTIPIVFAAAADPVGAGLVASLAQPGGTITGLSTQNVRTAGKRLELLKETVPQLTRLGYLFDASDPSNVLAAREVREAAQALAIPLEPLGIRAADELEAAFDAAIRDQVDGLFASTGPLLAAYRPRILGLAARHQLPAMYSQREFAVEGGLMAYAADFPDLYRRAASYVDRILKGARPADLPVEQATRFLFVVNLPTARALGLAVPPPVLAQATEVIQ